MVLSMNAVPIDKDDVTIIDRTTVYNKRNDPICCSNSVHKGYDDIIFIAICIVLAWNNTLVTIRYTCPWYNMSCGEKVMVDILISNRTSKMIYNTVHVVMIHNVTGGVIWINSWNRFPFDGALVVLVPWILMKVVATPSRRRYHSNKQMLRKSKNLLLFIPNLD